MKHLPLSKIVKKGAMLLCMMAVMSFMSFVYAQQGGLPQAPQQQEVKEDYSQEELQQFIQANEEVAKVQQEGEQEMIKSIEEGGLDVDTFNEILMARQNPDAEVNASEEELEKFGQISQEIIKVQQGLQQEVVKAVEDTGMDINKYSEMMIAYQNSPKVQEEVNSLLEPTDSDQ